MKKIVERINELIKKERGTIRKDHGGKVRICLIYPNIYSVGIANLGFQSVYRLFNLRKDVVCERAFLPEQELLPEYEKGYPLISFESKLPLYQFDILAFSLCFENDLANVIKILRLSRLNPKVRDREPEDPLIVAGGILCFTNPEPFAEIFDCLFVGEAEELISPFIEKYKEVQKEVSPFEFKEVLKKELTKLRGFYIPEAYSEIYDQRGKLIGRTKEWKEAPDKVEKVSAQDLSNQFNYSQIVTSESAFPNMFLVETMRGCPFNCRFCLVGKVYRPLRKVPIESIRDAIKEAKKHEFSMAGLIAPSISANKELKELLQSPDIELSFTSLRADKFTIDMVDLLVKRRTLTLAPEAGTERLRRVIGKGVSEEDILKISKILSDKGLENLKLYFMIGLPFEHDDDIDGIIELLRKIRAQFARKLTASISIFVPKPFTPFQWHRMEDYETVKEKLKKLKKDTLKIKGFKLLHEVPKYSYLQGYLSRADRRGLSIIERISSGENVQNAIAEVIDEIYFVKDFNDYLPWDFIVHEGIDKESLWREYEKAKLLSNQEQSSLKEHFPV